MGNIIIRPEIYFIEKRDENNTYYGQIITPYMRSQALYSKPFARLVLSAFKNVFHFKEEILAAEDAIDNSRLAAQRQQADIDAYYDYLESLETADEYPQKLTISTWLEYVRHVNDSIIDI